MSMTLSGNGTITGLVSGGLPDGTVLPADLSTGGPYWDTSGNFGLGVTPSAWYSGVKALQVGTYGNWYTDNDHVTWSNNQFVGAAGTDKYANSDYATMYRQVNGRHLWYTAPSGTAGNAISWTQTMTLDSSGNLQFNSGYGSAATAYGCRAWVNFNGQGTVAIRASGNVSSITDNKTGDYTVNFSTAMPDTNYATLGTGGHTEPDAIYDMRIVTISSAINTGSVRVGTSYQNGAGGYDLYSVHIAIFR